MFFGFRGEVPTEGWIAQQQCASGTRHFAKNEQEKPGQNDGQFQDDRGAENLKEIQEGLVYRRVRLRNSRGT